MFQKFSTTLNKTCWDKSWKSRKFKKWLNFSNPKFSPWPTNIDVESGQVLLLKAEKLCQQHWFGGRGVFALENRFSILSNACCFDLQNNYFHILLMCKSWPWPFQYLFIKTITLPSFWDIKPNHGWSYYRIINLYVSKIFHNPEQNLLRQKLKIQEIQEMTQFFKSQILPLTHQYQTWIWSSSLVKSLKTLPTTLIWGERGFFTGK